MSEQLKFHPEVEKAVETKGEDIGRVKDIELAHDLANSAEEAFPYETGDNNIGFEDSIDGMKREESVHTALKQNIVERAVVSEAQKYAPFIAQVAARGNQNSDVAQLVKTGGNFAKSSVEEAKIAGEELDTLTRAAKRHKDENLFD